MLTTIDDKRAKRIMMGLLDGDRTNELLDAACNKIVSETHCFWTDASMINLPPSAGWPKQLTTDMGNKQPFVLHRFDALGNAEYRQALGCLTLTVFNT